jgi:hypothetical protein
MNLYIGLYAYKIPVLCVSFRTIAIFGYFHVTQNININNTCSSPLQRNLKILLSLMKNRNISILTEQCLSEAVGCLIGYPFVAGVHPRWIVQ